MMATLTSPPAVFATRYAARSRQALTLSVAMKVSYSDSLRAAVGESTTTTGIFAACAFFSAGMSAAPSIGLMIMPLT